VSVGAHTEVVIEPKQHGKGRTFRAIYLASATADALWPGGSTDTGDVDRPVFATFCGSEDELRPFVANLMLGRRVIVPEAGYSRRRSKKGFEFLKTAGYKYIWQREPEGTLVSVFMPALFLMDPGMVDPAEAKFVLLPSVKWAEKQALATDEIVRHARRLPIIKALNAPPPPGDWRWRDKDYKHEPVLSNDDLAALVPTAYLFAAFLDRRTRAPLLADGRFYLQLMLACLKNGLATWSTERASQEQFGHHYAGFAFCEESTSDAGLLPGVAFRASHERLESLLAEEVALFFKMTKGRQ